MSKYAAAIIQLAIVLVAALAQLTGRLTLVDALQLLALGANAVAVYLVPLLGVNQRSGVKTGVAVVGALIAAGIPFATTHTITGQQVAIVLLAGLQALGAHVGVQIRNDAAGAALYPAQTSATTSTAGAGPVAEPPTDTTVQAAIASTGGEFIGEPAR